MDTSSVPLASRSDRPLIVVAPRNFLSAKTSGIKEWFERGGSMFLRQTCSPSLSLSFRIPCFPGDDCFPENNHFVSRCFEGREGERSSLVHSSHFERIGSLFLPIEPSPHHLLLLGYYVYPRHGDRDKVAPEERGRRRCYRFTRGCIKKRFF